MKRELDGQIMINHLTRNERRAMRKALPAKLDRTVNAIIRALWPTGNYEAMEMMHRRMGGRYRA